MKNLSTSNNSFTFKSIEVKGKKQEKSAGLIADNFLQAPKLDNFLKSLPPDLPGWIALFLKIQFESVKFLD